MSAMRYNEAAEPDDRGVALRITPIKSRGGLIHLLPCPGKTEEAADDAARRRLLGSHVLKLKDAGAQALVTVLEDEELKALKVEDVGATATRAGIWWFRLPIQQWHAPDSRFWRAWPQAAPALLEMLRAGKRVFIHSDGEDGRASLVACCLLAELGLSANDAVKAVRDADPAGLPPILALFVHEYLPRFPEHTRLRSPGPCK